MTDPHLRGALGGIRGLLLDLDGVLVMKGGLLPNAAESLARLESRGLPYVIATNMSLFSRATLSREMGKGGLPVPPERILCASSSTADYCRRSWPADPLYVMGAPDGLREFEGLTLLSHEEARAADRVAAVVVGDAGAEFTPANLQAAFRLIRGGAAFVAMHKNRWWITPDGPTMDAGAYVTALEFATERQALVTGKPSAEFFLDGVRELERLAGGALVAGCALEPRQVAMVGDDLWNDIAGAQDAGLRGIFVRSGKQGDDDLARFLSIDGRRPDAVAPSIAEVVAAVVD